MVFFKINPPQIYYLKTNIFSDDMVCSPLLDNSLFNKYLFNARHFCLAFVLLSLTSLFQFIIFVFSFLRMIVASRSSSISIGKAYGGSWAGPRGVESSLGDICTRSLLV